ncbi:hypothetical protein BK130_02870 [Viridibacillus sp. FSL H8-0123]|nr:hypothetical protein BK130_02870 [Viridibacillus sp. FSL H8-0123]OMC86003.1 hypothetical protein BK128_13305 [Viridibacillus sp. FSL H7-0596]OMC91631.1 hypothetical protein BK137_06825 [Viridibacillus arenosi]
MIYKILSIIGTLLVASLVFAVIDAAISIWLKIIFIILIALCYIWLYIKVEMMRSKRKQV